MASAARLRLAVNALFSLVFIHSTCNIAADAEAGDAAETFVNCTDDAMLILDASGSMVQRDKAGQSLLGGAQSAARTIIPAAAQHRKMGLVTLGPGAGDQCANVDVKVPVQDDAARSILDAVARLPADGGTPLTRAVETAADALDYRSRPAVMVVVSDGDETCGRDPCELARHLRHTARHLTIHVIGFSPDGTASAGARCLADETQGSTVHAKDAAELTLALRRTLVCPQLSDAAATALMESTGRSTSR